MSMPQPVAQFAGECAEAHRRLIDGTAGLDDAGVARPSRLPSWTVGHVLTHLARNADAYAGVLRAAAEGRVGEMYPGGIDGRAADIEQGARRPAAEILADLRASTFAFDAAVAEVPAAAWEGHGLNASGQPVPCSSVPLGRWREVEVHHADLGLGHGPAHWPESFVEAQLPAALDELPRRLVRPRDRATMLAWLWGRAPAPTGVELGPWDPTQQRPER